LEEGLFATLAVAVAVAGSSCGDDIDRTGGGQGAAQTTSSGAGGVGAFASGGASGICDTTEHVGEATYYDFADGSGKCMFDPTPHDLMVTAINHVDYADAYACGACIQVSGPDGQVTVRVVDYIGASSPEGNLDLSPDAFAFIAPLPDGRVDITWHYVPCAVQGPIVYHFKDGSTAEWWTAVQIRNHRHAIARVEYRDGQGAFQTMGRTDYNYFVADDGVGSSPIAFRVTDIYGHELVDEAIAHVENGDVAGAAQFPDCIDPG
jgi:expansin (peptidoglycan-binding protein)